ncbi:MAG: hypothetical protein QXQ66_09395, partial [Candidatus Hadarchaeum sp.]
MHIIKVGIITFSDGRECVHRELLNYTLKSQETLVAALKATKEVEPIAAQEIVWTAELARDEARRLAALGCEATLFNFSVWSFPHLAVIVTQFAPGPFLLFSDVNAQYPGMVGMLASAGALDQIGVFHGRLFGDIRDPEVLRKVLAFV